MRWGKLHVDRKEPAAAFAAYERAADLLRGETPYSRKGNEANAASAMTGYGGDFFDRMRARQARDTSRPDLRHRPAAIGYDPWSNRSSPATARSQDGGELNIVQHLAVAANGVSGDAIQQYLGRGGSPDALAGLYLHLMEERFGAAGRVVDKTVDASRYLGLIAAALPDAPLIWMRRDPLDSAWSCFRTFFIHGVGWSYSLSDIAHHFRLEDALNAYWQERLGDRLLVVPYAELVEAPREWTQRLLAHCGLAEEDAVHASHKTDRVVATASALQVRRPINRDGLGVADPYRAYMGAFTDAYFT